jgi:exosortase/archaeosortase family protein
VSGRTKDAVKPRNHAAPRGRARSEGPGVTGFVVRLLAGWAVAIGVLALVPAIEHGAIVGTVGSVAGALRLAALAPTISGNTITIGTIAVRIIPECTPVMPAVLLATAMAAYPSALRWKLIGVAAGLVVLWVFNVIRVLALFGTLAWWPGSFKFMHVYLWQTVSLLAVSALFLAWLKLAPARRAPA